MSMAQMKIIHKQYMLNNIFQMYHHVRHRKNNKTHLPGHNKSNAPANISRQM